MIIYMILLFGSFVVEFIMILGGKKFIYIFCIGLDFCLLKVFFSVKYKGFGLGEVYFDKKSFQCFGVYNVIVLEFYQYYEVF